MPLRRGDGLQQRPAHEEALGVQLALEVLGAAVGGHAGGLGGAEVQQLAGVVPLVDGLVGVEALVALEADQLAAGPAGQRLGHLGLADAGLALEEQRALQAQGEEDRRRQALVGEVAARPPAPPAPRRPTRPPRGRRLPAGQLHNRSRAICHAAEPKDRPRTAVGGVTRPRLCEALAADRDDLVRDPGRTPQVRSRGAQDEEAMTDQQVLSVEVVIERVAAGVGVEPVDLDDDLREGHEEVGVERSSFEPDWSPGTRSGPMPRSFGRRRRAMSGSSMLSGRRSPSARRSRWPRRAAVPCGHAGRGRSRITRSPLTVTSSLVERSLDARSHLSSIERCPGVEE